MKKCIFFFAILLYLCATTVVTSCPGGHNFDWNSQPHLDTVPAAIGHWVPPSATYAIDPVIYNATGDTTPIPAWIAPLALADTQ
ncbi:MAG: hypothetical protein WC381_11420, partial [Kiritimatiellia bacterium]